MQHNVKTTRAFCICFSLFFLFSGNTFSATWISQTNGNWNSAATWGQAPPGTNIGNNDVVIINHNVSLNQTITVRGELTINGGGSLIRQGNRNLNSNGGGNVLNNGALDVHNFQLSNNSSYSGSGSLTVNNNFELNNNTSFASSASNISVGNNFQMNNNTSFSHTGGSAISVGNNKEINNSGSFSSNAQLIDIGNNLNLNGSDNYSAGDSVLVGNNLNKNGSSTLNINGYFGVSNNLEVNNGDINIAGSGGLEANTININGGSVDNAGDLKTNQDFNIWSNNGLTNSGDIVIDGDFESSAGGIVNTGNFHVKDEFFYYGNGFTDDGNLIIDGGGENTGTLNGNGNLQIGGSFDNWGSISGTLDVCNPSGSAPTINGNNPSGGATICANPSSFPLTDPIPLPVVWGTVKAIAQPNYTEVSWMVYTQINNDYFEIECSLDGTHYTAIGQKAGCGNCNQTLKYSWKDDERFKNTTVYYRIKQVDFNGETSYSTTVSTSITAAEPTYWYNHNSFFVSAEFLGYTYKIYSVSGSTQQTGIIKHEQVSTSDLNSGVHLLQLISPQGDISKVAKLVVP